MSIQTIIDKHGKPLSYINSFKPGDVIVAYRKGFHEFVEYVEIPDYAGGSVPGVKYKTIFSSIGYPIKSKQMHICHASFCSYADNFIHEILTNMQNLKTYISNQKMRNVKVILAGRGAEFLKSKSNSLTLLGDKIHEHKH